jgi:hypothetical protein
MIRTKLFLACALAFAVSLAGTSALAQEPVNQITYFTFSAPFELPGGKVLPAGKYTFKIVDSPSNRHVVQIMSEDQKTMHATILAIPAQRQEPPSEPEVRFMETAANTPPAVRTWWYPGRTIGHEFIYPKDQARRLAARQTESVLTVAGAVNETEQMQTADLSRINATGQETTVTATTTTAQTTAQAAQTTTAQTTTAPTTPAVTERTTSTAQTTTAQTTPAPTTPAPATTERTTTERTTPMPERTTADVPATRTELPRTASPLPLVGLLGLASLLGAGVLRFRR